MNLETKSSICLEEHFKKFKSQIVGNATTFDTPYGKQKILYADWIASGRFYKPIENTITNLIGPMIANTHSFSSETGKASTYAYKHARQIIKNHVNANEDDVLVTVGSGMTGALERLQQILNLKWPDALNNNIPAPERPLVFITHMEHHSNQISWMETIAEVVIVPCDENNLVSPQNLLVELKKHTNRKIKIGAFSACSNVTGIITPYHELAKVMHEHEGICIVDFAASAPYTDIDMHPIAPEEKLDAILFSPHKFLGGPSSCGVLVFDEKLYKTECPIVPGGGNVKWTDPWGNYEYYTDIETKEDGGTPGFIQVMRTALAIRLKEKMNTQHIAAREKELLDLCSKQLKKIPGLFIIGDSNEKRIGCLSFGVEGIHYNLIVRLLNDRFGIQVRGGWSCASTYSHHLFKIDKKTSLDIVKNIQNGNLIQKPGWVRLSLHPTLTNSQANYICDSIEKIVNHFDEWSIDYKYNCITNEFEHLTEGDTKILNTVKDWFEV